MDEAALTQLLAHLAACVPERPALVRPSPVCVPVARLRSANLKENWTSGELHHLRECRFCQDLTSRARLLQWHPTPLQLLPLARDLGPPDADLAYHLEKDACRRCSRLASALRRDTLLARLGGQALEHLLAAAEVLPLPIGADRLEGERFDLVPLPGSRLQLRPKAATPAIAYLLFPGSPPVERFLPLLAGEGSSLPWQSDGAGEVLVCPGETLLHLGAAGDCLRISRAENPEVWEAFDRPEPFRAGPS